MKTTFATTIAIFFLCAGISTLRAQNTFPAAGNAGIGTATPTVPLEIVTTSGGVAVKIDPFTPIAGGTPATGEIRFLEKSANGTEYVGLKAPSAIGAGNSRTYQLPAKDGVSGQLLSTDGSGSLSWTIENDPQVGTINLNTVPKWDGTQLSNSNIFDDGSHVKVGAFDLSLTSSFQVNGFLNDDPMFIKASGSPALKVFSNLGTSIGSSSLAPAQGLFVFGNTGLGTNAPAVRLEVVSNNEALRLTGVSPLIQFYDNGATSGYIRSETGHLKLGTNSNNTTGDIYFVTKGSNRMFIRDNGNVGINTTTPSVKLHIKGNDEVVRIEGTAPYMQFYEGTLASGFVRSEDSILKVGTNIANPNGKVQLFTYGSPRITVDQAGNVGIGTSDMAAGYKLSVDGKVICEEVKVQLSDGWPDYVFQPGYQLMTLPELETFLSQNKHLPGIPPASQIEANGVSVGETQKMLMEKIEQLTLYVIELDKKVQSLEQENTALKLNR